VQASSRKNQKGSYQRDFTELVLAAQAEPGGHDAEWLYRLVAAQRRRLARKWFFVNDVESLINLSFLEALRTYNPALGGFQKFLMLVGDRKLRDEYKKQHYRQEHEVVAPVEEEFLSGDLEQEDGVFHRIQIVKEVLNAAVSDRSRQSEVEICAIAQMLLNDEEADLFHMLYKDGCTLREACCILGWSNSRGRTCLQSIRDKLREVLHM